MAGPLPAGVNRISMRTAIPPSCQQPALYGASPQYCA